MGTSSLTEWAAVLAAAALLAVLYEQVPSLGAPLLVLVVLVMLARAYSRGYLKAPNGALSGVPSTGVFA